MRKRLSGVKYFPLYRETFSNYTARDEIAQWKSELLTFIKIERNEIF